MIIIPRKKKYYNRKFSGKSGFILYAKKKTQKEAKAYKKRLPNHYKRVIKTPKTSIDYKKGFRYEIWAQSK